MAHILLPLILNFIDLQLHSDLPVKSCKYPRYASLVKFVERPNVVHSRFKIERVEYQPIFERVFEKRRNVVAIKAKVRSVLLHFFDFF